MHYDKKVREKGETPLRQAQLVMLEMLKVVDSVCKKHDPQYWLDGGTLLGAERHKGFIPWDDDHDIAMHRKDFEQFKEIGKKELPEDLFIQTRETDTSIWKLIKIRDKYSSFIQKTETSKNIIYHQGIFMDIFPYDITNKHIKTAKMFLNRRFHHSKKTKLYSWFLNPLSMIIVKTVEFKKLRKKITSSYSGNKYVTIRVNIGSSYHTFDYDIVFPLSEIEFEGYKFSAPNDPDKYLKILIGDYITIPEEKDQVTHAYKILPFDRCDHEQTLQY